jgi:hypothetical protein
MYKTELSRDFRLPWAHGRRRFLGLVALLSLGCQLVGLPAASAQVVALSGVLTALGSANRTFVSAPGPLTPTLSCSGQGNVRLSIVDPAGVLRAARTKACSGGSFSVATTVSTTGAYSVQLKEASGVSTNYTLTVDYAGVASTPQSSGLIGWALASSSLMNVLKADATVGDRSFNNPATLVAGPGEGTQYQVPGGWSSQPAGIYRSYAAFQKDVTAGRVDGRLTTVVYNPEMWAQTPLNEQRDPYTYMRMFCDLAHSRGLRCMNAPGRSLVGVEGAVCRQNPREDRSAAFLRCGVPAAAANNAEGIDIQGQNYQNDPVAYRDFVTRAAGQARAANPGVTLRSNLTTELQSVAQSAQAMCSARAAVKETVAGHWLNVTAPTARVAVEFLNLVAAGSC